MAIYEDHDLSEYYLHVAAVAVATAGTIAYVPIPAGGHVVSVKACITTVIATADSDLSFELGGDALEVDGSAAVLVLPFTGSAVGDCEVVTFDFEESANQALEAENGDELGDRSVLEIITDGDAATGGASFTITIRR